jgi:hypothetical protein
VVIRGVAVEKLAHFDFAKTPNSHRISQHLPGLNFPARSRIT